MQYKKIKQIKTLELIETLITSYSERMVKNERKKQKSLYYRGKRHTQIKISYFIDNLQLYLLSNYVYRILNKYITQSNIRNLVKIEILKALEKTTLEFVNLFIEIKKELNFLS